MDIGEAIAVLIDIPTPEQCPFCDSKEGPDFETVELVNDAAKLARNLGKMPTKITTNPEAEEDYLIFNKYWMNEKTSKIALNAHHILPGNASIAECPEVLQWIAGTVTIKKIMYDKTIEKEVQQVVQHKKDEKRGELVKKKFPTQVLVGDPEMTVTYSTVPGKKSIHRDKTVDEKLVTGKLSFDVNDGRNGIWLPSNNAIADWSTIKSVNALTEDEDPCNFAEAYAANTMNATGKQFHDAHPEYSTAVIEELRKFDIKLKKLGLDCLQHEGTKSKEDGPFPAPARLAGAMFKVATLIKTKKLDLNQNPAPSSPWYTSKLALPE